MDFKVLIAARVLDAYTDEELIVAWLVAYSCNEGTATSWATGELDYDLAYDQPERAWPIILELVRRAPDDEITSIIAAGPLENLLCEHGPSFIERVEQQAQVNPWFRHCLAGVWGWSRMLPEVYSRMRAAVGYEHL